MLHRPAHPPFTRFFPERKLPLSLQGDLRISDSPAPKS
jgi:hypothetical protein